MPKDMLHMSSYYSNPLASVDIFAWWAGWWSVCRQKQPVVLIWKSEGGAAGPHLDVWRRVGGSSTPKAPTGERGLHTATPQPCERKRHNPALIQGCGLAPTQPCRRNKLCPSTDLGTWEAGHGPAPIQPWGLGV